MGIVNIYQIVGSSPVADPLQPIATLRLSPHSVHGQRFRIAKIATSGYGVYTHNDV